MSVNKKILFFILLTFCLQGIYAQVDPKAKEPKTKKDSVEIYNKIKNYSKKNKFTQVMHKLLFRSKKPKKKQELLVPLDSTHYDGKIIRNINIITLDPFGHSVADTTQAPKNW